MKKESLLGYNKFLFHYIYSVIIKTIERMKEFWSVKISILTTSH